MAKNITSLILVGILLIALFLRIWRIDQVPVSLFGDELDVGYHAYSILKTGKDYSGNPWPLHFQSLAEWRTPLYLYSAVPTVALFGISPLGVRLPAIIFGVLGILFFYLLVGELLKVGNTQHATGDKENHTLYATAKQQALLIRYTPLLTAALLAISPWHIQYSRAGFEVTEMLALFLAGLWLFFKGLKDGKWLPISAACFALTPWVYSTAKFFTPLVLVALFLIWRKGILNVSRKWLMWSVISLIMVGGPIAYSTVFGGGTARFSYLSIFTDPTTPPQIGFDRLTDAAMRGEKVEIGMAPSLSDRAFHNKITVWTKAFTDNYLKTFSFNFLYVRGDPNLRHSIDRIGELYKIEALFLLLGVFFLIATKTIDPKIKLLLLVWVVTASIPAALTRDGGTHATRLFFLLPPLLVLVSFGIFQLVEMTKEYKKIIGVTIAGMYVVSFIFYQHNFWVHYPWESERWWHAGFQEAVEVVKKEEANFDKIIFSTSGEPPLIFFLGWYQYPPSEFHTKTDHAILPEVTFTGFKKARQLDIFYFGTPDGEIVKSGYDLEKVLDKKTLYIAPAKEINVNLVKEPGRVPPGLRLVSAIPYPSGEPAYYLVTGNK